MYLLVPSLEDKSLRAVGIVFGIGEGVGRWAGCFVSRGLRQVHLCNHDSMCGGTTQGAIPPPACGQKGTVYLELLPDRIPHFAVCFQAPHVAAMAEFSLRVASNDVAMEDPRHPVLLLLLGTLLAYRPDCKRLSASAQVAHACTPHSTGTFVPDRTCSYARNTNSSHPRDIPPFESSHDSIALSC